jgi:prophage regulatory protein
MDFDDSGLLGLFSFLADPSHSRKEFEMATSINSINPLALLRASQILGSQKKGIPALIPISRSSWYAGVREGKYPKPQKLGPRTSVWKAGEILALLEEIGS